MIFYPRDDINYRAEYKVGRGFSSISSQNIKYLLIKECIFSVWVKKRFYQIHRLRYDEVSNAQSWVFIFISLKVFKMNVAKRVTVCVYLCV